MVRGPMLGRSGPGGTGPTPAPARSGSRGCNFRSRLRDWTAAEFADGIVTDCATGSTAQDGDEVIDAEGGTILPGLIDSHAHLVPGALSQALMFGETAVLDMFSNPDVWPWLSNKPAHGRTCLSSNLPNRPNTHTANRSRTGRQTAPRGNAPQPL
jgi:hypothetical protein